MGQREGLRDRLLSGERGVALPLALVTLVLVSSLVAGALVTSSLEFVISESHQESIDAFYRVDGGIEAYLAEHGGALPAVAGTGEVAYRPAGAPGDTVWIRVVELADLPQADSSHLKFYSVRSSSER